MRILLIFCFLLTRVAIYGSTGADERPNEINERLFLKVSSRCSDYYKHKNHSTYVRFPEHGPKRSLAWINQEIKERNNEIESFKTILIMYEPYNINSSNHFMIMKNQLGKKEATRIKTEKLHAYAKLKKAEKELKNLQTAYDKGFLALKTNNDEMTDFIMNKKLKVEFLEILGIKLGQETEEDLKNVKEELIRYLDDILQLNS